MASHLKTLSNGRKAFCALLKTRITGKRMPVRISFLITKFCNLRCFYCYAADTLNSKEIREPTLEDLKMIVDQIYAAGCRWVNLLGGEPLIRNDIGELIDYLHRKGMFIEITTNGFFIKKRIEALKKIDHVCISLDGDKAANDKSRGEGSFEKIIEGIECAVAHGLNVRIHATLCKRTMAKTSLDFLAGFCRQRRITFNYSENGLPGIEKLDPDFLLSEQETTDFYRSYKTLKKNGYPIVSSDAAVGYACRWPLPGRTTIFQKDLDAVPKGSYYPCRLGRNQCFISSNGDVYACTKKWGYGKNLYEVGFQEAWDYLADLDCIACKELGTIEQSIITNLNPQALLNSITKFAL